MLHCFKKVNRDDTANKIYIVYRHSDKCIDSLQFDLEV